MITIPDTPRVLLYGPATANIASSPVDDSDYAMLPQLHKYLVDVMQRSGSRSLSAPQVGVFKQYLVFEDSQGLICEMVNPEIVEMYNREPLRPETCASVPPHGNGCMVPRMDTIVVEYWEIGSPVYSRTSKIEGETAARVQHEIDHLNGTFFFDRVVAKRRSEILTQFEQWKKERHHYATRKTHSRHLALDPARSSMYDLRADPEA